MSIKVSPLFLTREFLELTIQNFLKNVLKNLKNLKFKKTLIPKFDKSIDDRLSKNKWQKIKKKPDIVIFEGWCVGVTPQKNRDLLIPINTLEKEKDKKKIWRKMGK